MAWEEREPHEVHHHRGEDEPRQDDHRLETAIAWEGGVDIRNSMAWEWMLEKKNH